MPTRNSKNRKKRGHVSAGHGRVGKHRKHPSGRGNAGGQHHHRTLFDRYHPGYFGKLGMRNFHWKKNQFHCPSINVDRVWSLLPEEEREKWVNNNGEGDQVPVIDVTKFGFFKVLGSGVIPERPVIVKAKFFTKLAEEKLKSIGGVAVLTA